MTASSKPDAMPLLTTVWLAAFLLRMVGGVVLAFLLEFQAHEILEVFVIVKVPMNYNI